jgi:multidrug efflux pump subunit AcrA (membrane-fusion protein)
VKKSTVLLIIIALVAGVAAGTFTMGYIKDKAAAEKEAEAAAVEEQAVFAVNTTTAVEGQIQDYLALSGDVEASSTVDVYSDAAGKVAYLSVSVGQRVRKDQVLLAVDPSRPGMTFNIGTVKSPVAGTVVALPAQVGMTITQAAPVARVSAGNDLEIKAHISERFISRISLGQPVAIDLDAYPGESFSGKISEVSPVMDPASRTMQVKINVANNPEGKMKAGMFAKIRIITEQKNGVVKIPTTAMISRFGENVVFVVQTDPSDPAFQIVKQISIVPGIIIDGMVEVQSGLMPNDEVVVRGQGLLEDGFRVNIIDRADPLSAN